MIRVPVRRIRGRSCKAKGRISSEIVGYALLDDDMAHLGEFFWTLHTGYATRFAEGKRIFMHHEVLGRKAGLEVSHGNTNKLDNRRANLRHATRSENMLNPADGPKANRVSCPYRGVTRDDKRRALARPWRGKVTMHGRTYQTARFETPEEARDALVDLRALRVQEFPS